MKPRKPIRRRSKKMEAKYVERRKLVARLLEERPWCERCQVAVDEFYAAPTLIPTPILRRSTEIHELLRRSAGGDILDEDNCRALCHQCHDWIHDHPKEAEAEGWLKSRWDRD